MPFTTRAKGPNRPTVLHRCDQFVGRTTNWMYDHLRCIPRHTPIVYCDLLTNRAEFPLLEARGRDSEKLGARVWRRLTNGASDYPGDLYWLHRRHPRLLHSHFGYVATGDFALHDRLGLPWVASFYGADVYEYGRRAEWREKYARLFEEAQLILSLGPEMSRQLESLGCPADKILVHPLGVDVSAIPSRNREMKHGETLRLLFAGTFREKKGVEYAIRGAAMARARGVRLHLTLVGDAAQKPGDKETKDAIFREIDSARMNDVVTHFPYVEFNQLVKLALDSHVFVAPSVTSATGDAEGTPFVLQQMMATSMPVIATTHSDIPYLMGQHRDLLVPERDAKAIARRIESYADEPDRLAIDGELLRARMHGGFDVSACASRLSDIYDGVLTDGSVHGEPALAGAIA